MPYPIPSFYRLRERREALGLTQAQLAQLAGLPGQPAVSKLEAGRAPRAWVRKALNGLCAARRGDRPPAPTHAKRRTEIVRQPTPTNPYDIVLADLQARRDQITRAIDLLECVRRIALPTQESHP